eukprot:COSAG02_NODE_2024_length_10084_cov_130.539509_1_plen_195_part_00
MQDARSLASKHGRDAKARETCFVLVDPSLQIVCRTLPLEEDGAERRECGSVQCRKLRRRGPRERNALSCHIGNLGKQKRKNESHDGPIALVCACSSSGTERRLHNPAGHRTARSLGARAPARRAYAYASARARSAPAMHARRRAATTARRGPRAGPATPRCIAYTGTVIAHQWETRPIGSKTSIDCVVLHVHTY